MFNNIPVVILCGGYGTRISEETQIKPKPKKVVEREAETFKEPDYWESRPKKDTEDTWHWWFLGFCIFIIFILLS